MTARDLALLRSWLGIALGCGLLSQPGPAARLAAGRGRRPPSPLVAFLGLREVLQGALILRRPDRLRSTIGMTIDLLHAVSMVAATVAFPDYRRAAGASAGAAFAGAALLAPNVLGRPE